MGYSKEELVEIINEAQKAVKRCAIKSKGLKGAEGLVETAVCVASEVPKVVVAKQREIAGREIPKPKE